MRRRAFFARGLFVLSCLVGAASIAGAQPVFQQGPNLGTSSLGPNQYVLSASGGNGTYLWEITGGALPPGMSLRTDRDTWFPSNASAGLIGVATTPGDYSFTLRVTSAGQSSSRTFTWRIAPLLVGDGWQLPDAFLGHSYAAYSLRALNNTGAVTWSATSGLPPGMTLSSAGVLSGTPTATGFYNIQLRLQDSIDLAFRSINIGVYDVGITTPGVLPNALQNEPYTTTIQASGGTGVYTFSSCTGFGCAGPTAGMPTGMVLDENTGVISGTPTGSGERTFDITVTDSNHVSYLKRMSLVIVGVPPVLPSISPYTTTTCALGWPCTQGIGVNSGGRAPFTWSATGLPPGTVIRPGGLHTWWISPADAEIGGVPTQVGVFNVTVTVTDADGVSTTNTFPLRVVPLVLSNYPVNGTFNVPYSHKFRIYGGPTAPVGFGPAVSDYTTLYTAQFVSGQLPTGLTFDPAQFLVSGTSSDTGNHGVTFRFTDQAGQVLEVPTGIFIDGGGSSTIQINSFFDLGSFTSGVFSSRTLTACCAPSLAWSLVDGTLPPGVTLSAQGVLSGTSTVLGSYEFRIRAEDATFPDNFAIRRFKLAVVNPTTLQITTVAPTFLNVGTAITIPLTATGAIGTVTWALASGSYLPPGISLDSDAVLRGIPTSTGLYFFTVTATDSSGAVASRGFGIPIYPAGQTPPLNLPLGPSLSVFFGPFQFQLAATGGVGPYHYSWTPGATPIPGTRVQDGPPLPIGFTSTGAFVGVAAVDSVYSTSIRVTDSAGHTFDRAFTLSSFSLRVVSDLAPPRASVGEPYSYRLIPFGGTGNYSWRLNNLLPDGLTLDSSGLISGTPTVGGSFFTSTALIDLVTGVTINFNFTLTVNPFQILPSPILPQGTIGIPYNQPITAPSCGTGCVFSSFNLPFGLTLSSSGLLSGTPTSSTNTFFTVTATGSNGTAQKLFSFIVPPTVSTALVIATNAAFSPTTVGTQTTIFLSASGGRPPYTWSLRAGDSLPPGTRLEASGDRASANLGPGFAYILGRPMQVGVYTFTLDVLDSVGVGTSRTFTWNVSALSNQYTSLPISGTTLVYGTAYQQPLLMFGGTNEYTWTTLGPMPPGLSLAAATGVVSGTPTNTGFFSVPIQVTDTAGNSVSSTLNFTIAGATGTSLNFNVGPSLGTLQRGTTTTFSVTPTGGTGPYTVTALTALPSGFSLESDASLPGGITPGQFVLGGVALESGTFTFTLRAQDAAGNFAVRTLTLTISSTALVSSALPDASIGSPYSQPILVNDSIGSVSWSIAPNSVMPPGLVVTPGGTIQGIPTQAGVHTFSLTAQDSAGAVLTFFFSLRVSAASIGGTTILPIGVVGETYSHTFTGSGGNLVWSASGLPNGLTMSNAGVLTGTPTVAGTFSVLVTATDGVVPFSRRFALFVRAFNPTVLDIPAPTISDAFVGQSLLFTLNSNGGVAPYTWSVAPGSTLPGSLALIPGTAAPAAFNPGLTMLAGVVTVPGLYSFDLIVADSTGATTRRTFSLRVSAMGLPNLALQTGTTGVAYAQQLVPSGGTAPFTFSMSPASSTQDMLPPGYTFSASGLIAGTTTSTGVYAFDVTVTDGAGRVFVRRYNLTVNNASGLRIQNTNPPESSVGTGRVLTLSVNSGGSFSWSVVSGSLPPGVSIGGFGTPPAPSLIGAPSVPGVHTFTLRATDTANSSNFADHVFTYRVVALHVVSPPVELMNVIEIPSGEVGAPYSHTFKVAGGTPPYTFAVTPSAVLPAGLFLSGAGVLSGTPQQTGNYLISFTLADSAGQVVNTATLPIVIHRAGGAPPLLRNGLATDASVGVPYLMRLDAILRGGRAPFAWSISAGSSLPPGLTLIAGTNGVPNHIGGVATTPGDYSTALVVNDASGQTMSTTLAIRVTSLALSPDTLAPGRVGTAITTALVPSGGIAPYTIVTFAASDMPPGLSLSGAGVLSGTPTYPGNFRIALLVTDAAGTTLSKVYSVTIDNAAGQAPAIGLAPRPIQVYHELGTLPPVLQPVAVTTTSGSHPFSLSLAGVPGLNLATTTGTASANVGLNLNVAGLAVGTYVGLLGVSSPATANQFDEIPVTLTVSPQQPCEYSVDPVTATSPAAGGTGGFTVSAGRPCAWSAVPSDSWIIVTAGLVGSGTRAVSYRTSPNPATTPRTGSITVAGRVHSITQFGTTTCSFGILPSVVSATATGGSATINVTASQSSCAWTASGLGVAPAAGTGSGPVVVTVPPNPDPLSRVLTATIAGQTLTVNQTGVGCTASLSPYEATVAAAGGSGSVAVTTPAGCGYNTVLGPSWITVTSGASSASSGTMVFSVEANSATVARSGTLSIGGQPFQITQSAVACSVTIGTSGLGSPYGSTGGSGAIAINTNGSNCSWTASSEVPWATLSSGGGTGNGSITVTIASNAASATSRPGTLTVNGQAINISQAGTTCSYDLQSATGTVPGGGGNGAVGVVAPGVCAWTASSGNPDWLTITASGSGGTSDVRFAAAPNPTAVPRMGQLTIAGLTYTLTQAGAPCSYTLPIPGTSVAADGVTAASFAFSTAFAGCTPSPLSYANWITVTGTSGGGGSGTVNYSVAPNPSAVVRVGTIQVGDRTFTVTQLGGQCGFSLNTYGVLFNSSGGSNTLLGSQSALGCSPPYGTDQPSFIFLGTLSGPANNIFSLPYTVGPFNALTVSVRIGRINLGGAILTVKQTSY